MSTEISDLEVPPFPDISDPDWDIKCALMNSGSFCSVYQVGEQSHDERKRRYVVKLHESEGIADGGIIMYYSFLREWYSFCTMNMMVSAGLCENCCPPMLGIKISSGCGALFMEEGLCLSDKNSMNIIRREMNLDERMGHGRYTLLEEICQSAWTSLANLHSCGFLHRDIKPSNLVLRMSRNGYGGCFIDRPAKILIIDMNSVRPIIHPNQVFDVNAVCDGGTLRVCSVHTRAPEICYHFLLDHGSDNPDLKKILDLMDARGVPATYGTPSDVWSMGMCLLALVSSLVNLNSPTGFDGFIGSIHTSRFWKRVLSEIIEGYSINKVNECTLILQTLLNVLEMDSSRGGLATNWLNKQKESRSSTLPRAVRRIIRSIDHALILQPQRREHAFVLSRGIGENVDAKPPLPPGSVLASSRNVRMENFRKCQGGVEGLERFDNLRTSREKISEWFMKKSKRWEIALIGNILLEAWAGNSERKIDEYTAVITLTISHNLFSTNYLDMTDISEGFYSLWEEKRETLKKRWTEITKVVMEAVPIANWIIYRWYQMLREMKIQTPKENELSINFFHQYLKESIHVEEIEPFMEKCLNANE